MLDGHPRPPPGTDYTSRDGQTAPTGEDSKSWHGRMTLTQQAAEQTHPTLAKELTLKGSHYQPGIPAWTEENLAKVQLGTEGAVKPVAPKPAKLREEGLQ